MLAHVALRFFPAGHQTSTRSLVGPIHESVSHERIRTLQSFVMPTINDYSCKRWVVLTSHACLQTPKNNPHTPIIQREEFFVFRIKNNSLRKTESITNNVGNKENDHVLSSEFRQQQQHHHHQYQQRTNQAFATPPSGTRSTRTKWTYYHCCF